MLDVDNHMRRGVSVVEKEISILPPPVGLTHLLERASSVIRKIEGCEKGKEALGKTRGRDIPVIRARVVQPRGTKDTSVHIKWKVVIVETGNARRNRAKRREGVTEKPMGFRERKR